MIEYDETLEEDLLAAKIDYDFLSKIICAKVGALYSIIEDVINISSKAERMKDFYSDMSGCMFSISYNGRYKQLMWSEVSAKEIRKIIAMKAFI